MNTFLNLPLYSQIIVIVLGIPLALLFISMITRIIAKAILECYVNYKIDLMENTLKFMKKTLPGSPQNNTKKEGGHQNAD